LVIDRYQSAVD